jgi:hypothetical protein
MHVDGFCVQFKMVSPSRTETTMVVAVEPRLALPQALLNFVLKKMAGVILWLLRRAALRVATDPKAKHVQRIREDDAFYADWLVPKFQRLSEAKGWGALAGLPSLGGRWASASGAGAGDGDGDGEDGEVEMDDDWA